MRTETLLAFSVCIIGAYCSSYGGSIQVGRQSNTNPLWWMTPDRSSGKVSNKGSDAHNLGRQNSGRHGTAGNFGGFVRPFITLGRKNNGRGNNANSGRRNNNKNNNGNRGNGRQNNANRGNAFGKQNNGNRGNGRQSGGGYGGFGRQTNPRVPSTAPQWQVPVDIAWTQGGNQGNTGVNACPQLASTGSCQFYSSCFNGPISGCSVKNVVQQYCQNTVDKLPEFNQKGANYINAVRTCQTQQLLPATSQTSCSTVDNLATQSLIPGSTGGKNCLQQNGFCDVISTIENCHALFHIFGLSEPGVMDLSAQLFDYFLELSEECSEDVQLVFFENFFQKLERPPTPAPIMNMMGTGGD